MLTKISSYTVMQNILPLLPLHVLVRTHLRIGSHIDDDGLRIGHAQLSHLLQLIAHSIDLDADLVQRSCESIRAIHKRRLTELNHGTCRYMYTCNHTNMHKN